MGLSPEAKSVMQKGAEHLRVASVVWVGVILQSIQNISLPLPKFKGWPVLCEAWVIRPVVNHIFGSLLNQCHGLTKDRCATSIFNNLTHFGDFLINTGSEYCIVKIAAVYDGEKVYKTLKKTPMFYIYRFLKTTWVSSASRGCAIADESEIATQ